jgi:hypothetical protein
MLHCPLKESWGLIQPKGMLHGCRSFAKMVALGGGSQLPSESLAGAWGRVFWVSLAFAMALLAFVFMFFCFVDQFADRVKRTRNGLFGVDPPHEGFRLRQ